MRTVHRALLLTLVCLGLPACAGWPGAAGGPEETSSSELASRSGAASLSVDPELGEAIALVRATGSAVDAAFRSEQLSALTAAARAQGVPLRVVEIDDQRGAPAAVAITPLLIYQNHRGRSIYQGRTTRSDRFSNFLRTSRYVPQGAAPLGRDNVLVRRTGRSTVAVRLKVTALAGTPPSGFDAQAFVPRALDGTAAGWDRFTPEAHVQLARADRTYYADLHPFRDSAGQLHVTMALFSQFNCDIPVFQQLDPVSGDFADHVQVFRRAAAVLQDAVQASIADPADGDGFDVVPARVPSASWDQLGLALPARPASAVDATSTVELVSAWELKPAVEGSPPRLQFEFLPPLDYYSGEVTDVRCTLDFDAERTLASLRGEVIANAMTVTMGEEMLDDSLQAEDTLHTAAHPAARFVVERVEAEPGRLVFGTTVTMTLAGTFTLRGKSLALTTRATLEPLVNADGAPRLLATGTFQIPLAEYFGIGGPDGPSPAKDRLRIHFRFELAPRG